MNKIFDSAINRNYGIGILLYLLKHGEVPMSSLTPDVSSSYRAIKDLLDKFEDEGLIEFNKQFSPRRKFNVKLTEKGKQVAEKLKEIEEILEG